MSPHSGIAFFFNNIISNMQFVPCQLKVDVVGLGDIRHIFYRIGRKKSF